MEEEVGGSGSWGGRGLPLVFEEVGGCPPHAFVVGRGGNNDGMMRHAAVMEPELWMVVEHHQHR